jgi:ATP-binding cassette, subfamily F, member 3
MLIAKNLSYEGRDGLLFDNVDVSLDSSSKKRVAVVGKNGCGKTSLLKLLKGEYEPRSGSVSCVREVIGFLPQEITFPKPEQTVGEYLNSKLEEEWMSYKIDMALEEVNLSQDILSVQVGKISGGQKVRVGLMELLLLEPTILMMDEPTNHLDRESIEWLKTFVKNFNGSVIMVSHDRDFINTVANQIFEITGDKKIESYGMSYDKFLIERYNRYQKSLAMFEFSQREYVELENWLRENANHPKYKFTSTVAQKKKALERMEKGIPPEPVADPRVKMHDLEGCRKGNVLTLKIEKKSFGEREVLKNMELRVESGERLLIQGPNGSGKTTLMNIIAGKDKDFEGSLILRNPDKVGYLYQFCNLNTDNSVIDEFCSKTLTDYTLSRSILASFLFPAEYIDEKIKKLSFGQQRRLELAILLTNKPDLLLLDEPTNHLDIFIREDLENFLIDQSVAMIIISHDKYFLDKLGISRNIELE